MILFGASGHCKVVIDILKIRNIEIFGILDDSPKANKIFGIPIIQDIKNVPKNAQAIITIGNNIIRKKISERFPHWDFQTAIHPSATVSQYSEIGKGTVIMANAAINPSSKIAEHCIINTASVVEHDCILERFVHLSPNAALAGNVTVGEGTHVGIGASIIQHVKIGKWCTIGAGAVVIKDIPDFATVVGNPARIIKLKN